MFPTMNIDKVFSVFRKNYTEIPLEVFGNDPYKTLVSTVMSARTNDTTTLAAANRLFAKAGNFVELGELDQLEIEQLIYPVGFYKTKAKHLKDLAGSLLTRYSRKVPKTREELMTLPGVGRKTANLVLNRAFGIPAIAVDTHVHKISNMLGWVHTRTPEQTERELVKILPKKYWPETNRLFVSIGRQFTSKKKLEEFLKHNKLTNK
ncbi:MAG: putative endonuclease III (DNA-(apurinic orapyrimidinic site) lyase), endonuclease III [Microgenomates group bacterium GW2011_GWC1_39_7b]|uniref:DNA-(Apurinic or apyrimidinic site) lyase n=3 Tax=Candidatus Woeseibacteriota TaxID=1752722 RepID=A0A0G0T4R5_9BACT|nr:MAG: putative endonuclease III (DNA-(apurinic orapyrimidinic site) lyase), endonuclease III [Microgenomates group bacterium GW2011_GWC1_39_7b]KKR72014.1 MAG: DNA-(Apurinic or apyrimidinic site) lyase [Candidatus Woesebacteria bacterium GW2011_GWA2_40_7]